MVWPFVIVAQTSSDMEKQIKKDHTLDSSYTFPDSSENVIYSWDILLMGLSGKECGSEVRLGSQMHFVLTMNTLQKKDDIFRQYLLCEDKGSSKHVLNIICILELPHVF